MEGIGEWSSFFLHKHTYYQLYNSCYFSPLPNSIPGDQQMSWREVEGEAWKEPLWSCCSFPDGCKGMSLWPRTQWPVQLSQCSWSRLFFPGLRKNGKKSKKKRQTEKKRSLPPHVPALPQAVQLTLLLPPGPQNSQAWAVRGHKVVCYSNKRMYNLRCLWPCCVPARYINRSQVKPGCLLALFLKIKPMCQALSIRSLAQGVYLVLESAKPDQWSGEKKQLLELYRLRKSPAKVDHH